MLYSWNRFIDILQNISYIHRYSFRFVMRLYLFVWPKSLLIVYSIIKSLYNMVKINLEYFHCIFTVLRMIVYLLYDDYTRT